MVLLALCNLFSTLLKNFAHNFRLKAFFKNYSNPYNPSKTIELILPSLNM
jgi:hypothetical protein